MARRRRIEGLNKRLKKAHAGRTKAEDDEKNGMSQAQIKQMQEKQAAKLMKDFERANTKGRFKGKLARFSKAAAPTFVALTDHDREAFSQHLRWQDDPRAGKWDKKNRRTDAEKLKDQWTAESSGGGGQ